MAQRLARCEPARVARLVLVASTPCFAERPDWPHAMKPATLAEFAAGLAADRDGTLARFVRLNALNGSRSREAVRTFTARLAAHGTPSSAALASGLDWLATTDLRDGAVSIEAPTLVVHGARDALTPVEAGRWLAGRIPGAKLLEIGAAAHLPFFSHREAFLAALHSHLG
jgi:pimeloyl-[acyl-carrier protein] methyl ester esterase